MLINNVAGKKFGVEADETAGRFRTSETRDLRFEGNETDGTQFQVQNTDTLQQSVVQVYLNNYFQDHLLFIHCSYFT